jgi:signal peptide peptidase SppA
MKSYGHIVTAVYSTPWAILPSTLAVIVNLLRFRVEGGLLSPDEIEARIEAAGPRDRQAAQSGNGVAVLPLHGIIAPRAAMLEQTSAGGTGLDRFMAVFRTALADPEVGTILLDIDSPGGQVEGVPEAAAEIRAARERKPIVTVANGMAASAAYWIGSQALEFVATPSGQVGSIGVYGAHEDLSAAYEQAGVKTTLISAGKYKTEGNDLGPLSEETLAYRQSVVDDFYAMFIADVAKGRGVPPADVRKGYGEGRMLLAAKAKAVGMIDRIDTLGGTISRLVKVRPSAPMALAPEWATIAGLDAADRVEAYVELIADGYASVGQVREVEGLGPVPEPEPEPHRSAYEFEAELRRRKSRR